eukprot:s4440_g6.t1
MTDSSGIWTGVDAGVVHFSHDAGVVHFPHDAGTSDVDGTSPDLIQQFSNTAELAHDPIESFTATAVTVLDSTAKDATADTLSERYDPEESNGFSAPFGNSVDEDWRHHICGTPSAGLVEDGFMSIEGGSARGDSGSFEASVLGSSADTVIADHPDTQRALTLSLEPSRPKFLWEQDTFLTAVFGSGNIVDELFPCHSLKRPPAALVDLTVEDPPIKRALIAGRKQPVYLKAIKQSSLMHEETKRMNFISGWTSVVLTNIFAFGAFDRARTECDEAGLRAKTHRTVMECLASKATSTIGKRLGSMQRYVEYCAANSLSAFPLDDANMYSYLNNLCSQSSAAASSGKSFLEAVRFTSFMLGLRSEEVRVISQRVAGLAELLMKRAPAIAQAAPLEAEQVRRLERMCCTCDSLQDRVLLGGILIMVFGCARASDMTRAIRICIDRDTRHEADRSPDDPCGYIEVGVLGHKGAHSSTHKRLVLPVVAPMVSLSQSPWWDSWIEARMALNLVTEDDLDVPLMNRFDANGVATEQSLVASGIGEFLRQCLDVDTKPKNLVRSHSCKATVLSWMCKFGSPLHLRRIAGHHVDSSAKSAETYGRDSLSPSLRELTKVVMAVACGRFLPDQTRSGRFTVPAGKTDGGAASDCSDGSFEMPFSEPGESDAASESAETDISSDAETDAGETIDDSTTLWELLRPELRPRLIPVCETLEQHKHTISGVVHLRKPEAQRFLCGRIFNVRYERKLRASSDECQKCTTCFSSKDARPPE